jgi:hypothetical protein
MEPEGPLPCLQEAASGHYSEPDRSNPRPRSVHPFAPTFPLKFSD